MKMEKMMGPHPIRWAYRFTKKDGGMVSCATSIHEYSIRERFTGCRGKPLKVRFVPESDYRKLMAAWRREQEGK